MATLLPGCPARRARRRDARRGTSRPRPGHPRRRRRDGLSDGMELSALIHALGEMLGAVLRSVESTALFETEERVRAIAKARRAGDPGAADELARAVAALATDDARATA